MSGAIPIRIVTGLSGAGKSTALRAFEDLNYFTVDGLPCSLAADIARMMARPEMDHFTGLAIGMDMRQSRFLEEFGRFSASLAENGQPVTMVFLEASQKDLLRRYASTRRPHPLEKQGLGLAGAIELERSQLMPLREQADLVIDSSGYSIHDLRREILGRFAAGGKRPAPLHINMISFGYKYGTPEDADFVFDLRFLENPFFVDELRQKSGKDEDVSAYVFRSGAAAKFLFLLGKLMKFVFCEMEKEGRNRVTVAFGCTGGRHRSVALTEKMAQQLRQAGYPVVIEHRNIDDDCRSGLESGRRH